MSNWREHDLAQVETSELYRLVGILKCEQMIEVLPADYEADEKIAALEAEIAKRESVA